MCGISGYFGTKKIEKNIPNLLDAMKYRGPDNQQFVKIKTKNQKNIYLFHSRLSIIDLKIRSNQPMSFGKYTIIFNGEIYNYLELKKKIEYKGYDFKTKSDTEVVLKALNIYGKKSLSYLEGMWAMAIYDKSLEQLSLTRDRFGEKPLFYKHTNNELIFGSEINYLKKIKIEKFSHNPDKINAFLNLGYKSVYKDNSTFYKDIKNIDPGSIVTFNKNLNVSKKKFWELKKKIYKNNNYKKNVKKKIINSLKIRLRSDVPIGFCLSGGIDSTSLVSISKKIFNQNINTYSIIDNNKDYNETTNIDYVIKDLNIKNKKITFNKKHFIRNLTKLIKYRQMPVLTISYYVHSQISKIAKKDGVKILISGTGADEIFSGYYDHYILDIIQNKSDKKKLIYWTKFVKPNVKNPIFKNIEKFKNIYNNYSYIFDNKDLIDPFILRPTSLKKFKPHFFCKDILKNRMLNELFYESVPVILFEDDHNSMQNSIENRSPFLDKELIEYLYSIPSKNYIQNGYNKFLLRNSMTDILIDKVRLDRKKVGFNFDINNLIDLNNKKNIDFLLDKKSKIFRYVNRKKIEELLLERKINDNYLKKFIFSFISTKIFLDNCF